MCSFALLHIVCLFSIINVHATLASSNGMFREMAESNIIQLTRFCLLLS